MKITETEQGSSAWFAARCGVVTASEIDAVITPTWQPTKGQGRQTYLLTKAAEKIMGTQRQTGGSWAMDQGALKENPAAGWYEFTQNVTVRRVGFCLSDDGRYGCSPDGLVGDDGGVEIKSPEAHTQLGYLLDGGVPKAYLPQVHFSLYVTGRAWWDFVAYHPFLPKLIVRVQRDEAIISALHLALTAFLADLDAALAKLQPLLSK